MGVAISELIEKEEITLDALTGKKIGFDSYNIIYQFLSSIRSYDGTPLMDSNGRVTSHLTGLLYRTINLIEKGVKPVFVFDGKPHTLKAKTVEARHKIRTEAAEKHEAAIKKGELEEARKYGSRALKLTDGMVEDAKKLLTYMGLPVIVAPSDGEAQLSYMNAKNDIYGCASQDYDCLLFGAPLLLRNIAVTGRRKVPGRDYHIEVKPERLELKKVLESLGINRKKLIWLGILIGTDFNEKFPRIGPKRAIALVKKHSSFEDIIKETKHEPDFDYREIEKIFLEPEKTDDYRVEFGKPDKEKITEFLCSRHDFSEERVRNAVEKLEQQHAEKGSQQELSKWF
jgi:flap endonuclease-1